MGLFPSSGKGMKTTTLLGPLEGANLNHWTPYKEVTSITEAISTS
jgi:hypothetical protein